MLSVGADGLAIIPATLTLDPTRGCHGDLQLAEDGADHVGPKIVAELHLRNDQQGRQVTALRLE
jgi:hypothetical protein